MNYKAVSTDIKPFINWVFTDEEPDEEKLIFAEIPELTHGVYPIKILEDKIKRWTKSEMDKFKIEFQQISKNDEIKNIRKELKELFLEIQFSISLNESITELESIFDEKLLAFNNLKS